MRLNENGKIVYFADRWDHKDPPSNFIAWVCCRMWAACANLIKALIATSTSERSEWAILNWSLCLILLKGCHALPHLSTACWRASRSTGWALMFDWNQCLIVHMKTFTILFYSVFVSFRGKMHLGLQWKVRTSHTLWWSHESLYDMVRRRDLKPCLRTFG